MSHWCSEHPRYEAKPKQDVPPKCEQCLKLYLLRNPEDKEWFPLVFFQDDL